MEKGELEQYLKRLQFDKSQLLILSAESNKEYAVLLGANELMISEVRKLINSNSIHVLDEH